MASSIVSSTLLLKNENDEPLGLDIIAAALGVSPKVSAVTSTIFTDFMVGTGLVPFWDTYTLISWTMKMDENILSIPLKKKRRRDFCSVIICIIQASLSLHWKYLSQCKRQCTVNLGRFQA